jgi:hypothetical protein
MSQANILVAQTSLIIPLWRRASAAIGGRLTLTVTTTSFNQLFAG